ncbi:hypothetical protein HBI04_187030 [Parastagonospora nodorum]|nr:hypothetical protein HBI04_187030 [Parastagonospora nodorum]KAH4270318.1 hypothetical protein HBI03_044760 [Parastagonospora nodorum]KAH5334469.1 hypothetical protein HBI50_042460 [Parastagonospora nodorum]
MTSWYSRRRQRRTFSIIAKSSCKSSLRPSLCSLLLVHVASLVRLRVSHGSSAMPRVEMRMTRRKHFTLKMIEPVDATWWIGQAGLNDISDAAHQ